MLVLNVSKIKASITAVTGNAGIPSDMRQHVINFGLARLVAYSVGIPAEPVTNPAGYFTENNKLVLDTLSAVNETVVIDIGKIVNMALAVWRMRYDGVHNMFTKESIELSKQALVAADIYNFNQAIKEMINVSDQFTDLGKAVDVALSLFNPFIVGE